MDGGRIDKISPVPYYYQLEQLLREKIERTPRSARGYFASKLFLFQIEQMNKRLRNKAAVVTGAVLSIDGGYTVQ